MQLTGVGAGGNDVDTQGRYVHLRYSADMPPLTWRTGTTNDTSVADFVTPEYIVEFDADSMMSFPYPGVIEVVGGAGTYKGFLTKAIPYDPRFYKPELRTLRTVVKAGGTFTIPDHHTRLAGINSTSQFNLPGGDGVLEPGILPGITVSPGLTLTAVKDTIAVTGVWL